MDKVLYDSLYRYFTTLTSIGNVSYNSVNKLLVLIFYKHFIYEDYRGNISKEDYNIIEQALNCLFGSTCLIPYPNYLGMINLHLGDITEMAHRIADNESHIQEMDNIYYLHYPQVNLQQMYSEEMAVALSDYRRTVLNLNESRQQIFYGGSVVIQNL